MALFALRDIDAFEELGYDYNFSLFNAAEGQVCAKLYLNFNVEGSHLARSLPFLFHYSHASVVQAIAEESLGVNHNG